MKLPSCSTSKRSNSLRFVYHKISIHIHGLSSLGVASDQYGGLLIPVIMSKLPNEVCVRIARESTVWKIEELMDVIKQDVEAREVSKSVKITEERNQKPPSYLHKCYAWLYRSINENMLAAVLTILFSHKNTSSSRNSRTQ